ncbi:MAG: hypothetical protein ABH881_00410 [bacterium]
MEYKEWVKPTGVLKKIGYGIIALALWNAFATTVPATWWEHHIGRDVALARDNALNDVKFKDKVAIDEWRIKNDLNRYNALKPKVFQFGVSSLTPKEKEEWDKIERRFAENGMGSKLLNTTKTILGAPKKAMDALEDEDVPITRLTDVWQSRVVTKRPQKFLAISGQEKIEYRTKPNVGFTTITSGNKEQDNPPANGDYYGTSEFSGSGYIEISAYEKTIIWVRKARQ